MRDFGKYFTGKNLYSAFLHIALLVLAFEVVLLAKRNRDFKQGSTIQRPEVIEADDYFSIEGLEPLFNNFHLEANSRQLFFIFTTKCPFSEKDIKNWKTIVELIGQKNRMITSIALDLPESTMQYATENNLNYPILYPLNIAGFKEKNKLNGVPITLIIDKSGHVEKVWLGVLTGKNIAEAVAAVTQNKSFPEPKPINGGKL